MIRFVGLGTAVGLAFLLFVASGANIASALDNSTNIQTSGWANRCELDCENAGGGSTIVRLCKAACKEKKETTLAPNALTTPTNTLKNNFNKAP